MTEFVLRKRVAEGLIKYYDKYKLKKNCIHLTRDNLASLVGATTESVIRTLSEFKNDKLININGKTIEILNEEELRNMMFLAQSDEVQTGKQAFTIRYPRGQGVVPGWRKAFSTRT